jgi:hypothetical protein
MVNCDPQRRPATLHGHLRPHEATHNTRGHLRTYKVICGPYGHLDHRDHPRLSGATCNPVRQTVTPEVTLGHMPLKF